MGNKVTGSSVSGMLALHEFEHISGRHLIEAINANDTRKLQRAIDQAKAEFSKPVSNNMNQTDYDEMIEYMTKYLTKEYNVGDGILFVRTPLKYCADKNADECAFLIRKNLDTFAQTNVGNPKQSRMSNTVGEINKERVSQAKERLKEFQKTRSSNSHNNKN